MSYNVQCNGSVYVNIDTHRHWLIQMIMSASISNACMNKVKTMKTVLFSWIFCIFPNDCFERLLSENVSMGLLSETELCQHKCVFI